MKRLRKTMHFVLVWTTVCLLMVDPAAACRLLGNRRCRCRCCCVCESTAYTPCTIGDIDPSSPTMPTQPSPSDRPPQAATEAGTLPIAPLAAPSPLTEPSQPINSDPIGPPAVAGPGPIGSQPPGLDRIAPAAIQPRPNAEPATSPLAATAPPAPRQPASVVPPAAVKVAPPSHHSASKPRSGPQAAKTAPAPATLKRRQHVEPVITTAPPTPASEPPSTAPATAEPAEPMIPKQVADTPAPPVVEPQIAVEPRPPAPPEIARPTEAVRPPAFPPVDDDPFAPLPPAPATAAPRSTRPIDDDPFAPVNPAPATQPKSAPPIAAEPTSKRVDPLALAADGRLPLRHWTDNSGQFQVQARLMLILDGKVRLLKETGRTTTVPTERLSAADQQYIAEIIARYGRDLTALDQLAAR